MGTMVDNKPKRMSFEAFLRWRFKWILDEIASFLIKLGLHPNTVTILGLVGNIVGAVLIGRGYLQTGGVIVLFMGPVDALDGAMARLRGESSRFGAFVDSVTDRYSELVILGGLMFFYLNRQDWVNCALVYVAAAGSVLVSYVKARAEGLDYEAKVGVLTRVERYLVLAPALVIGYPQYALWIIAIFANITALQRIWYVRRQAYQDLENKKEQ